MTDAIVHRIPRLRLDHIRSTAGRQFLRRRQAALIDLMVTAYNGTLPAHASGTGFCLTHEFIDKRFGKARDGSSIQALLAIVFDIGQYGPGEARSYTLREPIRAILDTIVADDPHTRWPVVNALSGETVALSSAKSGSAEVWVPELIEISDRQLVRAMVTVQGLIAKHGPDALYDPATSKLTLRQVFEHHLIPLAQWQASAGGVSNRYVLGRDGRLYSEPGAPHIITMPRIVRALLLTGSGLLDVDIVNCGPSMLASLAHGHGIPTPLLNDYLNNRDAWLARLSDLTGDDQKTVKRAVLALVYGGSLGSSTRSRRAPEPAIPAAYRNDTKLVALRDELTGTFAALFREHISDAVNLVGMSLQVKHRGKLVAPSSTHWREKRRHVLTGAEQLVIRLLCRYLQSSVVAVIFDGAIIKPAPDFDVTACQQHIADVSRELLGYPLTVRLSADPF